MQAGLGTADALFFLLLALLLADILVQFENLYTHAKLHASNLTGNITQ
jgi:hypothetical protein